jgi:hypothetical protein
MQPRHNHRQSGQIAPLALFGVLIASGVLVLMFNTGQKITERSNIANAADAAAYSGAVWAARHLNFLAYTNRAMIANHAAAGHFVSYVSWVRYIHDSIEYIDRVAQWIPYVGQYVDMVEQIAEQVREATEQAARTAVPAIDAWNAHLRSAQVEAHASLVLDNLHELMQQTAQAYDPSIRINDRSELDAMPDELRRLLDAHVLGGLEHVSSFVERYVPGNDRGRLNELITASIRANGDLQRWASGERGWRENLIAVQLRKLGSTTHVQNESAADWRSSDQLQHRTRSVLGWRSWRRIGDRTSTATAREFDRDYSGVSRYYNVAGEPGEQTLRIAVIATKRQSQIASSPLLGMNAADHPVAVAAEARVRFRRPSDLTFAPLGFNRSEYSNLFNPFWEANLAQPEVEL